MEMAAIEIANSWWVDVNDSLDFRWKESVVIEFGHF